LIEADTLRRAFVAAHSWTASMKQATVGVEIQQIPPPIKAVEYAIDDAHISDVSSDFGAHVEQMRSPGSAPNSSFVQMSTTYHIGQQPDWEQFEFRRALSERGKHDAA
jgi:hypothetical protein